MFAVLSAREVRRVCCVEGARAPVGGIVLTCLAVACGRVGPEQERTSPSSSPPSSTLPGDVAGPAPMAPWEAPAGGEAVGAVALDGARVTGVDARGNLWLDGCDGRFVVTGDEVRRYRLTDPDPTSAEGTLYHDPQGRTWQVSRSTVRLLEGGEWREVLEQPLLQGMAVGSDGVAWVLTYDGPMTYASHIRALYPIPGAPVSAPSFESAMVPGADGALWYGTSRPEIFRFADGVFYGPYPGGGALLHDPSDDSIAYFYDGELHKVAFDGGSFVERATAKVPLGPVHGYERGGRLVMLDDGGRIVLLRGDQVVERLGAGSPLLNPLGELYFTADSAVYHYTGGSTELVFEFAPPRPLEPPSAPWSAQGYGRALQAPSTPAAASAFDGPRPAILEQKVRVTGQILSHFEAPLGLYVDGTYVASAAVGQELFAFTESEGLQLVGETSSVTGQPFVSEDWDITGYLVAGECFDGSTPNVFNVLEAYPLSLPPERRAALEQALRERYPE